MSLSAKKGDQVYTAELSTAGHGAVSSNGGYRFKAPDDTIVRKVEIRSTRYADWIEATTGTTSFRLEPARIFCPVATAMTL